MRTGAPTSQLSQRVAREIAFGKMLRERKSKKERKTEMVLVKREGTQSPPRLPYLAKGPALLPGNLQFRNSCIYENLDLLRPHLPV